MALIDAQFPQLAAFGTEGGGGYKTSIVALDSGSEQRLSRWPTPLHRYSVQGAIRNEDDYAAVRDLHHVARGAGDYFRFKDWLDYRTAKPVTHTDCELVDASGAAAVGDGSTVDFYLAKKYVIGTDVRYRPLTLPVDGTVKIGINGVDQASGWTVELTTGKVTFSAAPAISAVLTGGCEFDVPCRFEADYLPARIVNKAGSEFLVRFDVAVVEFRP